MSVSSMTNVAFERREDVGTTGGAPKTVGQIAQAKGDKPTAQGTVTAALSTITTYIPTEVLTLYVAVVAVTQPEPTGSGNATQGSLGGLIAFLVFLILTPVVVWLVYAAKCASANKPLPSSFDKWPKWEMIAATIAYAAWAGAFPNNPFEDVYSSGLAGIVVLVVSTMLGLVAPIANRPLAP